MKGEGCAIIETLAQLTQLLDHHYAKPAPVLTPIHRFPHDDRGIYRVDIASEPPLLLRAYRQTPPQAAWLVERAATLVYLASAAYPAPRVVPTVDGALTAHEQGWSTLLLTYVEGTMATGTAADFHALGQQLARLHKLEPTPAASATSPLPYCRWQPQSRIIDWLAGLNRVADQCPAELRGLYAFSVETLTQVAQWTPMPVCILHADPNSTNAVRTPDGALVLVDWDGAGLGPPLLDLGYLLLTCHLGLPSWPQIAPAHDFIAAIMAGYCSVRALSPTEITALPVAVCFNDAGWAAQGIPAVIGKDWRQHRGLHRFGARYPTLAQVGEIAQEVVTRLSV